MTNPLIIGWKEYGDFVDWRIRRVKIKIDTGARTSALDVCSYALKPAEDGTLVAELQLQLGHRRPTRMRTVYAPVLKVVEVRNTSGNLEERPVIETRLRLGPVVKSVQLTVTNRSCMLFRMILGRTALDGD